MNTELNKTKREHDFTIARPSFKAVVQVEVKAAEGTIQNQCRMVQSALDQLAGGKEELRRLHGRAG
jgi:hypothetical protein